MAEEQDQESKTEEPTEKRISDAVEKGNVPFAREATLLGSIASILTTLLLMVPWVAVEVTRTLREALAAAGGMRLDDREGAAIYITSLAREIGSTLLPVMLVIAAGTVIASLLQNVPSAAVERITPRASRISPLAGWKRLFGKMGFVEFGKSVLKLVAVSVILWFTVNRDLPRFVTALSADPRLIPGMMLELASGTLVPLLILALALALADLVWARLRWRRELRMTHHDIRQEVKEAEGEPLFKARARGIARQRSSRRMLDKLPGATVVITNPTHYAVALRYVRTEGGAPVVVAKGVDHMALRIREIATQHEVPLIENRPLARGLYEQVDIDEQIRTSFSP